MNYKGFQSAQAKYDNACPPELNDYESYSDSEDSSSCDPSEDDDIVNYRDHLEELQRKAIERDRQRFLDRLFNTWRP